MNRNHAQPGRRTKKFAHQTLFPVSLQRWRYQKRGSPPWRYPKRIKATLPIGFGRPSLLGKPLLTTWREFAPKLRLRPLGLPHAHSRRFAFIRGSLCHSIPSRREKKFAHQTRIAVPLQRLALPKTRATPRHNADSPVLSRKAVLQIGFGSGLGAACDPRGASATSPPYRLIIAPIAAKSHPSPPGGIVHTYRKDDPHRFPMPQAILRKARERAVREQPPAGFERIWYSSASAKRCAKVCSAEIRAWSSTSSC